MKDHPVYLAIKKAIEKIGLKEFKKTSFFMSNHDKV